MSSIAIKSNPDVSQLVDVFKKYFSNIEFLGSRIEDGVLYVKMKGGPIATEWEHSVKMDYFEEDDLGSTCLEENKTEEWAELQEVYFDAKPSY